jgi:hypothetical protein
MAITKRTYIMNTHLLRVKLRFRVHEVGARNAAL